MRKFTDEELRLAPQVAEAMGPHEIYEGDYFHGTGWWGGPSVQLCFEANSCCAVLPNRFIGHEDAFWIPSIEDCLGWLNRRGWVNFAFNILFDGTCEKLSVSQVPFKFKAEQHIVVRGDTLLGALYRCILSCGQNGKKGE